MSSRLFSPFSLRGLELDNRIVVSPMAQYSAVEGGVAGDWHLMHIGSLAVSGPGLIIMEATAVQPGGRVSPVCLGLWSDDQIAGFRRVIDFARAHSTTKIGIQLAHAGRKASVAPPWLSGKELSAAEGGWATVGPSPTSYPGRQIPAALDEAALASLTNDYVEAARRAFKAGFDLLELHCAHGYLLNSFLSPLSNARTDDFGGDIKGRMRFPLAVFKAIRAAWPDKLPLGVRISAIDWVERGWDIEDSIVFAKELKALGCDYVTPSSGGVVPEQKITVGPGYQVPFSAAIRERAGIATMAVGMIGDGHHAEQILDSGAADLIAIGRGMTYDPRWSWHAAEKLGQTAGFPPQYARSHPSMRNLPR
jgi:2,4-dienoyl-CoA reductase-like NADH-dependent reductase (Old Yellow Enzyme family)